MEQHTLSFNDTTITREGVALVSGLHMSLSSGDLLMVQGANGSGKSTLLKAIAGLFPVSGGSIDWYGAPVTQHAGYPNDLLFLGHKRGLRLEMSVLDNVRFWARMRKTDELVDAALHYFDLESVAHAECRMLSAGWQQRVALTRLITMPSILWLLDEPTANLDDEATSLLHSLIMSRIEQKGIVIMTTHAQVQGEKHKTLDLNAARGERVQ
jgi:heme exporter protein A